MSKQRYQLAVETSSRQATMTLGCGDQLIDNVELSQPQRHAIELMPAIDRLTQTHGLGPTSIDAYYVSVGPGSFTGLRIGVTTVKLLAMMNQAAVVAVPTLDVIVANQSAPTTGDQTMAICLNARRGQCYTGIYDWQNDQWRPRCQPTLLSIQAMLEQTGDEKISVLCDHLPEKNLVWPERVTLRPAEEVVPHSKVVWRLGRQMAANGQTVEPIALAPSYMRLPEAEEVWQAKQAAKNKQAHNA